MKAEAPFHWGFSELLQGMNPRTVPTKNVRQKYFTHSQPPAVERGLGRHSHLCAPGKSLHTLCPKLQRSPETEELQPFVGGWMSGNCSSQWQLKRWANTMMHPKTTYPHKHEKQALRDVNSMMINTFWIRAAIYKAT